MILLRNVNDLGTSLTKPSFNLKISIKQNLSIIVYNI